ncbi:hypothetical protein ACWGCW_12815 [Streptomyces sp. NPDC054933]
MADNETTQTMVFDVSTGTAPTPAGRPQQRKAEVQAAFDGLLQVRKVMNTHVADPLSVPAEWERHQIVRAVALTLEAAELPPSAVDGDGQRTATGYCVTAAERSGTVRVEWMGPRGSGAVHEENEALGRCAAALSPLGWVALQYRGPRRHWYLEVEPVF